MAIEKNVSEVLFEVKGDWEVQAKSLKLKYPQLTDGDLKLEPGRENEMLKRMEAMLYKNRDEVISIIKKNESEKA